MDDSKVTDEQIAEMKAEKEKCFNDNRARFQLLAAEEIFIDFAHVAFMRINYLLDSIIGPEDTAQRIQFEIDWEKYVSKQLDETERNARQNKLLQGVQFNGKLSKPPGT